MLPSPDICSALPKRIFLTKAEYFTKASAEIAKSSTVNII
jgi:hypothetical protein